jgi:hypothetical protein
MIGGIIHNAKYTEIEKFLYTLDYSWGRRGVI